MNIEIDESVVPEGYEAVRFGLLKEGDYYLSGTAIDVVGIAYTNRDEYPKLILRKKAVWRDAKVIDIDKNLRCRCRDRENKEWVEQGVLIGWVGRGWDRWFSSKQSNWAYCQVLDKAEPQ